MASTRLMSAALRFSPLGLLVSLEAWVGWDLLSVPDRRWSVGLSLPLIAGVAFLVFSRMFSRRWARWVGLIALGSTYVVLHGLVLGVQLVPALAFVSLLIVQVELRILGERFAPLFLAMLTPPQRRQIGGALLRALVRLTIASILAVILPLLAADLALAGVVPVTTIPTALILSAGLVAVVLLIALLPTLERERSESR